MKGYAGRLLVRGMGRLGVFAVLAAVASCSARELGSADTRATRRALHAEHSPTQPVGRSTQRVPTPITEAGDGSGRWVMRRLDSTTFFTPSGLRLALFARDGGSWLGCDVVGARGAAIVPEGQQHGRAHRYVGDRTSWAHDLRTYDRIAWEEIRPGVDMIAEPEPSGLEYRFVLSPGALVSDVAMHWSGARAVRAVEGGVDVETALGVLRIRGLRAFVVDGDARIELPARHVVHDHDVSFEVDGWRGDRPLVIDPVISWSTYVGGSSYDDVTAVAIDGAGNALVTGSIPSTDYPVTGGFDTTINGSRDAFVMKIDPAGAHVWSTFLGGSASDDGHSIAVDASGNAFVTGITQSTNFPTTSGFDTTYGGSIDAFVTKLSSTGALEWSTYLGGASFDWGWGVAVDSAGNAWVAGATESSGFPTTGGFDTTYNGGDAFVSKFSGSGSLLWSSFLGGGGFDAGRAIAIDGDGNALVAGSTNSTDFPGASLGFDTTNGGGGDAFIAKIQPTGGVLWSSYLGGGGSDEAVALAVDASRNVFVTGRTSSTGVATTGAFDTTLGGTVDIFVAKASGAGALLWATYLGGASSEEARGIAVDSKGDALVTGSTYSVDFPTDGGFWTTHTGTSGDGFVTKIIGAGALSWSSYLPPALNLDFGTGVAFDASDNAIVTGSTENLNLPSGPGFDKSFGGARDGYVLQLRFQPLGGPCSFRAECSSAICADGVCCDKACAGTCEACTAVRKGGGTDGTCGPVVDGADPIKECAAQTCASGVVTNAQVCNGAGACRGDGTTSCGPYPCAGAFCATSCTGDFSCSLEGFCSFGKCVTDLDPGAACTRNTQCKSGFCVDSVCCDKECAGPCDACTAAKKGSGADGTCAAVAADTDPKDRCPVGTGACAADGQCDGAGNCRSFAKAGTACGATTCSGGVVVGKVCKGDSATCLDSTGIKCAPYACDATACKSSCAADGDCEGAAFCASTGACTPKLVRGKSCKEARECASGHCVDGVCCESSCSGQCESCGEAGTEGTCAAIIGKPRGARAACDTLAETDCAKAKCDGTTRDKCAGWANGATTACGADGCNELKQFQKAGTCNGEGKCAMPAPQNCAPFVCDATAKTGCKASCTAKDDCTTGFACSGGACVQGSTCNEDKSASIDGAGNSIPCAPFRCGTDGTCLAECTSSDQCVAGRVCDRTSKLCVEPAAGGETADDGGCSYGARPSGGLAVMVLAAAIAAQRRRRRAGA